MLSKCRAGIARIERRSNLVRFIVISLTLSSLIALCPTDALHQLISDTSSDTSSDARSDTGSNQTTNFAIQLCYPCKDNMLYIVIMMTGISCSLICLLGIWLILRREADWIMKNLPLKIQAAESGRRLSGFRPGLSTTESTTSSVLVKMLKGLKQSVQKIDTKNSYQNEIKALAKV